VQDWNRGKQEEFYNRHTVHPSDVEKQLRGPEQDQS